MALFPYKDISTRNLDQYASDQKYLPVAHCQREGERARQKWCAFLKKNSTLIFFLFKLKAQYSQINNPFLNPKPEGKIHFWYSE